MEIRSLKHEKLDVFRQFAELRLDSFVDLTISVWYEIPSEAYMEFAVNFTNLRNLKISFSTNHKINFFAKYFPNLEAIDVTFGHKSSFSDVFEVDTGIFN